MKNNKNSFSEWTTLVWPAVFIFSALPSHSQSSAPTDASATRFSTASLEYATNPCVDFYQFACGGWLARNAIPSDQSRWGRFSELAERNRAILKDILEQASDPSRSRDGNTQKIGDFYASCMDEKSIDSKGLDFIKPELDRIAALKSKSELPAEIARLHSIGVNALFSFDSDVDAKDSARMIAEIDEGGLGLPDRDYYLKQDAKSADTRKQYSAHVQQMLQLLGDAPSHAEAETSAILEIETELATAMLSRTDRRDPDKVYHKLPLKDLDALAPSMDWKEYLAQTEAPKFQSLNVTEPDFLKGAEATFGRHDLDQWKAYLKWHLIHALASPFTPSSIENSEFDFYGRTLNGQKEIKARWKRCVQLTDHELGEALGKAYVDRTFGPDSKARMLKELGMLREALKDDLETLPWMTPKTREFALQKLTLMEEKIGYPDKWRDYSKLDVIRGDGLGNLERAEAFEVRRRLTKIGKPVDKKEWDMTPPTVNAYYDPEMNNINFPAGILQPPFFDNALDDAVNLGGIGAVIGHEMTHGFDDEGRKFDAQGNLRDWWTPEDAQKFDEKTSCLVNEYSSFVATEDVHLNGKLTLGENTADNGGLRLAYMALEKESAGATPARIDGFTPEQRLFLGFGGIWCNKQTGESARMFAIVDPHSPGKYRVNGVVSNMPEFQKAWNCPAGSPMVRANACRVW